MSRISPAFASPASESDSSGRSDCERGARWKSSVEIVPMQLHGNTAAVREGSSASPTVPYSPTSPPPLRFPRFPESGKSKDVHKWSKERNKLYKIHALDPDNNLPTRKRTKDPGTTDAVQDPREKAMIRIAAQSVVSINPITNDGLRRPRCSGIIIHQEEDFGFHHVYIVTCSRVVSNKGRKLDTLPKLSVGLPDRKTFKNAHLMYFNDHYDIALLSISLDSPLKSMKPASIGQRPDYNQEVFVLARDKESSLMVRRGRISWSEEADIVGRNYYMFFHGEVPEGGTGGAVIDNDGNFRAMVFHFSPHHVVLSISTICTCFKMFMKFGRVARPMLGLGLRTVAMVCVSLQEYIADHGIENGFIVATVAYNSEAEQLGIRRGNVIVSLNGEDNLTMPELEDYLLAFGWNYLEDPSISRKDLKLKVCDLKGRTRSITLPLRFCDTFEYVCPVWMDKLGRKTEEASLHSIIRRPVWVTKPGGGRELIVADFIYGRKRAKRAEFGCSKSGYCSV